MVHLPDAPGLRALSPRLRTVLGEVIPSLDDTVGISGALVIDEVPRHPELAL